MVAAVRIANSPFIPDPNNIFEWYRADVLCEIRLNGQPTQLVAAAYGDGKRVNIKRNETMTEVIALTVQAGSTFDVWCEHNAQGDGDSRSLPMARITAQVVSAIN